MNHRPTQAEIDTALDRARRDRARLERDGCRAMGAVCIVTSAILGLILGSLLQ